MKMFYFLRASFTVLHMYNSILECQNALRSKGGPSDAAPDFRVGRSIPDSHFRFVGRAIGRPFRSQGAASGRDFRAASKSKPGSWPGFSAGRRRPAVLLHRHPAAVASGFYGLRIFAASCGGREWVARLAVFFQASPSPRFWRVSSFFQDEVRRLSLQPVCGSNCDRPTTF